ncbi:hypothetical protein [Rhizobium sp. LjRoot254]|uniref:hypothetical protein n=1 Tax=Rhizobium sp. LjRoot254 TaxID=3342297 RepID=UPI003ECC6086
MRSMPLVAALCMLPLAAVADDAPVGRYQISPALDGYVRLDTATGAMLYCRTFDPTLRCEEVGADTTGKAATEAEMDDLRNRLAAMERKVAILERDQIRLPDQKDLDRTLDTMEKWMRRFLDDPPGKNGTAL